MRLFTTSILFAYIISGFVQAAVIATFPSNPALIIGYGENPDPLVIDFNSDGKGDVFMVGNGPAIDFHIANGNRALVLRPRPPNLGGLLLNMPEGFVISGLLNGTVYWYGGFPDPMVAEVIGIPQDSNFVSFGAAFTNGSRGLFINKSGYFGIEFKIGAATHYGWVHITNETGLGHGGYIDSWAYESTPDMSISAGAIPEPQSLFLLVFSSTSMLIRKRPAK